MRTPPRIFRVLLVEDNAEREELFRSVLPDDVVLVWAKSGGQALGILQRDRGRVFAGILLDHDLVEQARTGRDRSVSGSDVTNALITTTSPSVPVLVHSMNHEKSASMVRLLKGAGFDVTRLSVAAIRRSPELLAGWIELARELWEEED